MSNRSIAMVREALVPDMRPPPSTVGFGSRVQRAFFSSWLNTVITLICLLAIGYALNFIIQWGVLNAIWVGDGEACRANAHAGACWAFVWAKMRFMFFGFYPPEEHWRLILVMVITLAILVVSAQPRFWKRWLAYAWLAAVPAVFILINGGILGLSYQPTRVWGGLPLTLLLAVVGLAFGFPLGILLALGRRSKMPLIRNLCVLYIETLRGVPLITILFMSSVLFPLLLPEGAVVDKLLRAQVALIIFAAAFIAEVVRGGLQALPKGQYEAADSLGLGYALKMRKIILPQALKIVIPALVNIAIGFFKDTSLVIIIGLFDFLTTVKATLNDGDWLGIHIEAYLFAALVYFIFCFSFSRYSIWLEKEVAPERVR